MNDEYLVGASRGKACASGVETSPDGKCTATPRKEEGVSQATPSGNTDGLNFVLHCGDIIDHNAAFNFKENDFYAQVSWKTFNTSFVNRVPNILFRLLGTYT